MIEILSSEGQREGKCGCHMTQMTQDGRECGSRSQREPNHREPGRMAQKGGFLLAQWKVFPPSPVLFCH